MNVLNEIHEKALLAAQMQTVENMIEKLVEDGYHELSTVFTSRTSFNIPIPSDTLISIVKNKRKELTSEIKKLTKELR